MQFLLDVQVISGSNSYSNRPWALPSSSDGDGEKDSSSSSLNSGCRWTSYGRIIRERYWKAKYALYSICPNIEEESRNDKNQQRSGEDNDKYLSEKLVGGWNKDFQCERNRDEPTGYTQDTISSK